MPHLEQPGQGKLDFDAPPKPRSTLELRKAILEKRQTGEKLDAEEEAYRLELIEEEREDDNPWREK